ncbi:MAG: FAD-dependent oxidoreductase [Gammaproteobacteria bacterium]
MTDQYDVVVVGGGIHGVGVAQAAACAGYSVMVLEKTFLASGSSSRSSKLIHGGLRYLEGFDFSLVRESLVERRLLLKLAPDLVHLEPFHIPVYAGTSRRPLTLRAGLLLYAFLGGLHSSCRFRKLDPAASRLLCERDGLVADGLQAVFQYFDAQTNDRDLTCAVMQSAMDLGAVLHCPAEFIGAEITTAGSDIRYTVDAIEKHCRARVLVNAGGPWVRMIDARVTPDPPHIELDLVQGTHLIVEGRLQQGCYYMEVPADRRAVFLLQWGERALLGTTENLYRGAPEQVAPLAEEEAYLLAVMQHYFPGRSQHVIDRFAGLRVLPASTNTAFKRSRETHLEFDNPRAPGYVSIYGGKLTGYRATAEKIMHALRHTLPVRKAVANTRTLKLNPV